VSGFSDASKQLVVPGQKSNANYSVWIYVDAWKNSAEANQYKKNILTRTGTVNLSNGTGTAPIFLLHLDNATNNLHLKIALSGTGPTTYQTCTIKNIKLQKWVNITMSIYGNTVDLYLDGKKQEAAAKVPSEWLLNSHLVGPKNFVKERLAAFKEAGVTVISVNPIGPDAVQQVELLRSLIDDVR
jgi:hypothetical protein